MLPAPPIYTSRALAKLSEVGLCMAGILKNRYEVGPHLNEIWLEDAKSYRKTANINVKKNLAVYNAC